MSRRKQHERLLITNYVYIIANFAFQRRVEFNTKFDRFKNCPMHWTTIAKRKEEILTSPHMRSYAISI